MTNPLLKASDLPLFSEIKPEHIVPAIEQLIEQNRNKIKTILQQGGEWTWENLPGELESEDDKLNQAWSPVGHMNAVINSDELRDAYNACLPKLSEFATEVGQNQMLYKAYQALKDSAAFENLSAAQKKIIANDLRDFHLSGIDLPEKEQKRFGEISKRLSEITSKFSDNVLDATQAWSKEIKNISELKGMPDSALEAAQEAAKIAGKEGYRLTLEFPSYFSVITYCDNRELRKEIYTAYCTRASDQGPDAGRFDNSHLMEEILTLRQELAKLLGYKHYGELSLVTKMADSVEQVETFLYDLAKKALPAAKKELAELKVFAKKEGGIDSIAAWDIAYFSEKLRQVKYSIAQEELRPWFPVEKVLSGMFQIASKLYGIQINKKEGVDSWHQDVQYFEIKDKKGKTSSAFFIDLFARSNKRGGAWMDECRVRRLRSNGSLQLPVAYLTCNFNAPLGDKPALLTHDEVLTLFHEFGHGLHHMLTKINYGGVSGINGVAWDAVELPSQFFENWCWESEAITFFSGHYKTNEPLPKDKLNKLLAAKNFQVAMQILRQIEFSIFDLKIHTEPGSKNNDKLQKILDNVRTQVAVILPPEFNRFQHSFSHIFAGGYAAGYYSYKWAEILSADAFSRFEEEGIFNQKTGHEFLSNILEMGGSKDPMELFIAFRGREPNIDALLRHCGISTDQ